jgi:hypothetical protein
MMRVPILLLLMAAPLLGQEIERLRPARWPHKVIRFGYRLPEGRKRADEPKVLKAKVNKLACFFVDLDGDGRFNEKGVDGWALTGMNYLLPLEDKVVMELHRIEWSIDEQGQQVEWKAEPLGIPKEERKVFRQFNYWRLINGLPPVDYDAELSGWCDQHCAWMEKNGFKHAAEEGDGEMSREAAHAGRSSMLSQEGPGMSVLMLYSSFYHRLPLFRPSTRSIGIGCSKRYTSIDGITKRDPRAWQYPIIVPAPNSALQPTNFAREAPRPHPAGMENLGCPITLTFENAAITEVRAKLSVKRKQVPILVSSPEEPANSKRPDNRKSICLIPRSPLRPNTLYSVEVTYKRNGEVETRQWVFKTGRRRPVWGPTGR